MEDDHKETVLGTQQSRCTHEGCNSMHKICANPSWTQSLHGEGGRHEVLTLARDLSAIVSRLERVVLCFVLRVLSLKVDHAPMEDCDTSKNTWAV